MNHQQAEKQKKQLSKQSSLKSPKIKSVKLTKQLKSTFNDSFLNLFRNIIDNQQSKTSISLQDRLHFEKMYRNGICKLDDSHYNIQIMFEDVNYRLAHPSEKKNIFESYCQFLNSFDSSVVVQLSAINIYTDIEEEKKALEIPLKNETSNEIREEYQEFLKEQLEKGTNGLKKYKYITCTLESSDEKLAHAKLNRLEIDIINQLKQIGVRAIRLNGDERLKVLHDILNDQTEKYVPVDWDKVKKGFDVKNYITPTAISFEDKTIIKIKDSVKTKYACLLQLRITASHVYDSILSDILDLNAMSILTINFNSLDQEKAKKSVTNKNTSLTGSKTQLQKQAVANGYDMDTLPEALKRSLTGTEELLSLLSGQNEKFFDTSMYLTIFADSKQKLHENIFQAQSIIEKHTCKLNEYDFGGENSLNSFLPLGRDELYTIRNLTTSSLGIFVPFTTQELFQPNSIYYGLNKLSNNMILADRKKLKNPNGLILGVPGSGKSFATKLEMLNVFLTTDDDIMILDPEGEYGALCNTDEIQGSEIILSQNSNVHINPLDINIEYSEDDDPVSLKQAQILSFMEIVLARSDSQLTPLEKSSIDRAVHKIYAKWKENPIPENIPILSDLKQALESERGEHAHNMAEALYVYTDGSQNMFNYKTNIDFSNRFIVFNIRDMNKSMKKLAMVVVQDAIWNRVSVNRNYSQKTGKQKYTWTYFDELHLLLKDPQTASFTVEIWKRLRKWGGIPTGMTQNVKDFLRTPEIENIFDTTDFYLILSQGAGDKQLLVNKLEISESQVSFIADRGAGEGLIKYGDIFIPFYNRFPEDTKIFKLINTSPKYAKKIKEDSYGES